MAKQPETEYFDESYITPKNFTLKAKPTPATIEKMAIEVKPVESMKIEIDLTEFDETLKNFTTALNKMKQKLSPTDTFSVHLLKTINDAYDALIMHLADNQDKINAKK